MSPVQVRPSPLSQASGQNVAIVAPRRYGKSSLAKAALSKLIGAGVLAVEVDLMSTPTKDRLAGKLAKAINDDLASVVLSRSGADIDDTLERLFELPATIAADTGKRVVVFFDEFQEVTEIDPQLTALMRSVFQKQQHVSHIYAGSKRHMMHRLFNDENEPFFRSAKTMEIGRIDESLFEEFIRERFDRTDRGVSDEAVDGLLAITKGHPYATQELAYALWEEVPVGWSASARDLEDALHAVLRAENAHFTFVWERMTKTQKLLLQALAKEEGRPFSVGYRDRHGLPSTSHLQRALRPLIEMELVAREKEGSYDFAEPFLREWILAYAI